MLDKTAPYLTAVHDMSVWHNTSSLGFKESVFFNNTSVMEGGAIYVNTEQPVQPGNISNAYYFATGTNPLGESNVTISSTNNNHSQYALQINIEKCSLQSNYGQEGGVLYSSGPFEIIIRKSLFKTNSAINGGAIMANSFSSYTI